MAETLCPARFYGSSLPRPRFYADTRLNDERVDPPLPVMDPLLSWANDAHWSMGGLSFQRKRLQGRIDGKVSSLRAHNEKVERKRLHKEKVERKKSVAVAAATKYALINESDDEDEPDLDNGGNASPPPMGENAKPARVEGDEVVKAGSGQARGGKRRLVKKGGAGSGASEEPSLFSSPEKATSPRRSPRTRKGGILQADAQPVGGLAKKGGADSGVSEEPSLSSLPEKATSPRRSPRTMKVEILQADSQPVGGRESHRKRRL